MLCPLHASTWYCSTSRNGALPHPGKTMLLKDRRENESSASLPNPVKWRYCVCVRIKPTWSPCLALFIYLLYVFATLRPPCRSLFIYLFFTFFSTFFSFISIQTLHFEREKCQKKTAFPATEFHSFLDPFHWGTNGGRFSASQEERGRDGKRGR